MTYSYISSTFYATLQSYSYCIRSYSKFSPTRVCQEFAWCMHKVGIVGPHLAKLFFHMHTYIHGKIATSRGRESCELDLASSIGPHRNGMQHLSFPFLSFSPPPLLFVILWFFSFLFKWWLGSIEIVYIYIVWPWLHLCLKARQPVSLFEHPQMTH